MPYHVNYKHIRSWPLIPKGDIRERVYVKKYLKKMSDFRKLMSLVFSNCPAVTDSFQ